MVKQNLGGYPVAVFRFPARTRLLANEVVTVWSGAESQSLHKPPTDFVCEETQRWGTGPDRTTIVCKPDGQVCVCLSAGGGEWAPALTAPPSSASPTDRCVFG